MTATEVRDSAESLLKELNEEQLIEVAKSLSLTLKDGKKNKKEALRNLITRHLRSDAVEDMADEGLDCFQKVLDQLTGMVLLSKEKASTDALNTVGSGGSGRSKLDQLLKLKEELEQEESTSLDELLKKDIMGEDRTLLDQLLKLKVDDLVVEGGRKKPTNSNSDTRDNVTRMDVARYKLKEFKIDGGIVGGAKNGLDLCSLDFQMKEGRQLGYSEKEIRTGVIKSIKAGTSIRRYFERNAENFTEETFKSMLEELFQKKESHDLVEEMCERVQAVDQNELEYVIDMLELRDNIMKVTEKEDEPLGPKHVQRKMLRAISVGLRKDTVRLELKDILKDHTITDHKLMAEVNAVVARDTENRKKMGKGRIAVNALSSEVEEGQRGRSQERRGAASRSSSVERSMSRDGQTPQQEENQCRSRKKQKRVLVSQLFWP